MSRSITDPEHFMCKPGILAPALVWRCRKCRKVALTYRGALRLDKKRCKKGARA